MFSPRLIQKKLEKEVAKTNTTSTRKKNDKKEEPAVKKTVIASTIANKKKKKINNNNNRRKKPTTTTTTTTNNNNNNNNTTTTTTNKNNNNKPTTTTTPTKPTRRTTRNQVKRTTTPGKTTARTDVNKNQVTRSESTPTTATVTDALEQAGVKKRKRRKTRTKTDKPGVNGQLGSKKPVLYTQGDWSKQFNKWHGDEDEDIDVLPHDLTNESTKTPGQTSDSEHSVSSERSTNGRKEKKRRVSSEHENSPSEDVPSISVGECLATATTERSSVVTALAQGTTLYLQGCVTVRPLLGCVEVLGYVVRQGQTQPLYSLPTCSLLGVMALEGGAVNDGDSILQEVPSAFLDSLKETDTPITVVEFSRHVSPRLSTLVGAGWKAFSVRRVGERLWHGVGVSVITPRNRHRNRLLNIMPQWKDAAETIVMNYNCGAVPRVVIGGSKGVGKSTLFKYLVNSLLSTQPDASVLCLDLDPGQPELGLPSALSLSLVTKPLLGPAYIHDVANLSSRQTHILAGGISPQFMLDHYTSAVKELCGEAGVGGEVPVVVNTMGWTQGTGLGLMLDVVRLVCPTHVLQIQDNRPKKNFPFPLEVKTVAKAEGGITTIANNHNMHYSLTLLPCAGNAGNTASTLHISQPRVQRDLRVLAEAGQAVDSGHRVSVPWTGVALHVCGEQVPKERILQVINAQLVSLCRLDPASLHVTHPDLPMTLVPNARMGRLLGWAVVMAVDPLARTLHLATLLPPTEVNEQVNAIIMPRMHLPVEFYTMYCMGKGPYLERGCRVGANRLRVGRSIKPRGPRD